MLLLLAALAGPLAAAPIGAEPPEAASAGMEARLEAAIAAKLEARMGGELAAHQAQIAVLQTKLAGQAHRLDALAASDEQQQAQLDRCKPASSAAPPAPGAESVAAELRALRAGQEAAVAGHAVQQAQIDALLVGEEARRRLQAAGPASQGEFVRIYRFTVDANGVSQTAAASRGGKRRVLAEEASCTKDYVQQKTAAINDECPWRGSNAGCAHFECVRVRGSARSLKWLGERRL
jgi:hypothetical protein